MRPIFRACALIAWATVALPCLAMMAGTAPDSPQARIDANSPESAWAGVVALRVGNGVYSAVAVAPRHILTAAHVAGGKNGDGAGISLVLNISGNQGQALVVTQVEVFPGYAFPYDDLALLTLSDDLPEGVPLYPINDLPPVPGQTLLTLVGYGASGTGDLGNTSGGDANIKRVGENMLDTLRPSVDASGRSSSFFLYDFDGPDGDGAMGGPTLGNARESMVSGGDSGAPAFTLINGYHVLTGICTFATPLNSGRALNYGFGQGGGGMLLSDARFIVWLLEKSGGSVRLLSTLPESGHVDYRLPALAAGTLLTGLAGALWWRRRG
ncbi:hypothetical protein GCM10027046_01070 [Uliginosibacterium flavum]|uniref:Trypsin-like peptidase domain-containing protein n=1 Tax=Uliginosibacterium flavum TaxID=1396831 RepID=A0ABV2THA9_9RHOO